MSRYRFGMRMAMAIALVAMTWATAAAGKPKVAILGLEVAGAAPTAADKDLVDAAHELTAQLRLRVEVGTPWVYVPGSDRDLLDEKLLAGCDDEALACMAMIGANLGADVLVYGKIERRPRGFQVTLRRLDVGKRVLVVTSIDVIPAADATAVKLGEWAKQTIARLGDVAVAPGGAPAPVRVTGPKLGPQPCEFEARAHKGDELFAQGNYGPALASYQKAYQCRNDELVLAKMFIASCKSNNPAMAKQLYKKLPENRKNLAQVCIHNFIELP
jgi:hypothetical protein